MKSTGRMNLVLKTLAILSLAGILLSSIAYARETIALQAYKQLLVALSLGWFGMILLSGRRDQTSDRR
jgi:hypothetical protein